MPRILREAFPMFSDQKTKAIPFCAIMFCALLPQVAGAGAVVSCPHVTDGVFTSPGEWANCPTAVRQFFAPAAGAGGSFLYVDQGTCQDSSLYLMYDYVAGTATASFFDVFFEVVPRGDAYLVRID